jgi:flavin reductase (DIM6/NTAB) family NADH-FMN oxidoreductase RutF
MSTVTEPETFRHVLGHYPTGVCVITATQADGKPVGMAVGSFTSVSLDPPLVAFFPDRSSSSWPKIEAAGSFCVNILAEHQESLCRTFASSAEDKFVGITHRMSAKGAPILDDVVAWIDCDLYAVHEAGDHFIVLGEVQALDVERPHRPLLFFQGGYGQFWPLQRA